MSSDDVVIPIFDSVCSSPRVDRIYVKRWGIRNTLKVSKIIALLKSIDYDLYIASLNRSRCNSDDCLGRVITRWIYNNLKTSISEYYTLGDICNAVFSFNRRRI